MVGRNFFWPLALALLAAFLLLWPWPAPPGAAPASKIQADLVQPVEEPPKLVALTFDDGPRANTTSRLLDGLAQRNARATFFLIGSQLGGNEDLVRRMDQEGHQIGIHTYDHILLTDLSRADFDAQVARTRQALTELLDEESYVLRPPYGEVDQAVKDNAGCPIILWSVDPEDWNQRGVQREVSHIVSHVQDGDIILMHDIYPESVDAALQVVDQLHQEGYVFVTVEELFSARGVPLEAGKVYRHCHPD